MERGGIYKSLNRELTAHRVIFLEGDYQGVQNSFLGIAITRDGREGNIPFGPDFFETHSENGNEYQTVWNNSKIMGGRILIKLE